MNQGRQADPVFDRLPGEVVDWLMKPFASFLRIEAAGGAILLVLTIAALVLSNSPWAHQFLTFWELPVGIQIGSLEAARSLRDWVNDALMTLFWLAAACLPASASRWRCSLPIWRSAAITSTLPSWASCLHRSSPR